MGAVNTLIEKEMENKMANSAVDLLRKYSDMIAEADSALGDDGEYDPNKDELAIDDQRLANINWEEEPEPAMPEQSDMQSTGDPVSDLANFLSSKYANQFEAVDLSAMDFVPEISNWLKQNGYAITRINGVVNREGKI